jgi:hypothetical protein
VNPMSVSLEEALQAVDLEPGRTYRCQVRGQWVELQVLGPAAPPTVEAEAPVAPWTDLPEPSPVGVVRARLAPPELPDVPDIPTDEPE